MRLLSQLTAVLSISFSCLIAISLNSVSAADWNQWRGPDRTGYVATSPAVISELPTQGLTPTWITDSIPSAKGGGWGSPVVADGKVYLFSHKKELVGDPPGEKKFPYLSPEKRAHLSDEEYAEHEKNRRAEDAERAKAYEFREFVHAFDALTGQEEWVNQSESTYTRFPQSGCPTIVGGKLLILGAGRTARCLDAKTGEQLWETKLPGEFSDEYYQASVLVIDQIAVFNATHLFGLDLNSGSIVWSGDPEQTKSTHASPAAWTHQGKNYVISVGNGGNAVCLNPQTGEVIWKVAAEGGSASPVVTGDKLLIYGNSRKKGLACFKMTPQGADQLWVFQRITDKGSTPIVANGAVYVQGERKLACVDLETGQQLWMGNLDMENPQWGSPIAAGDIGFYAYDGILGFSLNPDDFMPRFDAKIDKNHLLAPTSHFRELYQMDSNDLDAEARKKALTDYQQNVGRHGPLKCATPAFADGFLYLRLSDRLVCYDLRAASSQVSQK
ncbi:PQQ-like beta-propeller repeat protein [Rubinisphaera sp.]|uniref:PQQ-like beta-propeller repeat protein n=1 Tax=Rubinisphaera sp. TaxID=2024857 RepID=UPI000C102EBC|nr:PQQ-like beta-propeller repeat protein [Rubinisphaera sp.]MBV12342.1 hypothetical protein [Rubinisphaera sp.]